MRILMWHVHGGWTDAFVQGNHDYLLPVSGDRGPWGLGRGGRDWPNAHEVPLDSLADLDVDVVLLQRPDEVEAATRLLGRRPGRDVPAVYVEYNTPRAHIPDTLHPLADQSEILLVHVTHFNELMWDNGRAPTTVVEHGVRDPGPLYTGELESMGVVVNEPVRRQRVAGTDLLPRFAEAGPIDVFGMGTEGLHEATGLPGSLLRVEGELPPARLHGALARRRVYLHPMRWTSLGLSLLEAMHVGMPVIALATTEAIRAIPPEAGVISTEVDELVAASRMLLADPDVARARGSAARSFVLEHHGLQAFLERWDTVLADLLVSPSASARTSALVERTRP